jgi:hypothetical protein
MGNPDGDLDVQAEGWADGLASASLLPSGLASVTLSPFAVVTFICVSATLIISTKASNTSSPEATAARMLPCNACVKYSEVNLNERSH